MIRSFENSGLVLGHLSLLCWRSGGSYDILGLLEKRISQQVLS